MQESLRRRRRSFAAFAVFATVIAVILSGCSNPTAGQNGGQNVLRLSVRQAPASFAIGSYGGGEIMIQTSIFDTLLAFDMKGEIVPNLATKYEYNADRTVLTLAIRGDAKFSNGEVVNAQAVVANLKASQKAAATSGFAEVKAIEATDERTVVMTLTQPSASLVPNLAGVGGFVAAPSTLGTPNEATQPVGSGPYVLNAGKTQIGVKYVLDKVEGQWRAKDYPFDHIEISVIADPTAAVNGFQSGQLDHVTGIALDQANSFKGKFTTGVDNPTTFGNIWLADRGGEVLPALADKRVRQAINMALDRSGVEKLAPGQSHGINQVYSEKGGAYRPELKGRYPHDIEDARKLMAEAGYAKGFSVTMPSTIASTQVEPFITQSLADIGITVKWETVTLQNIVSILASKKYPMYYFPSTYLGSDALDTATDLAPVFNPFGTTTPELAKLLATANASGERTAFADVNRYFIEEAWFAPVMTSTFLWAHVRSVNYIPPALWGYSVQPWSVAKS